MHRYRFVVAFMILIAASVGVWAESGAKGVRFEDCTGVIRYRDGTFSLCTGGTISRGATRLVRLEGLRGSGFHGTLRVGDGTGVSHVVFRMGDGPEGPREGDAFAHLGLLGYVVRFENFVGVVTLEDGSGVARCGDGIEVMRGGEMVPCAGGTEIVQLGGGVLGMGDEWYVRGTGVFRLEDYTGFVRFEPARVIGG